MMAEAPDQSPAALAGLLARPSPPPLFAPTPPAAASAAASAAPAPAPTLSGTILVGAVRSIPPLQLPAPPPACRPPRGRGLCWLAVLQQAGGWQPGCAVLCALCLPVPGCRGWAAPSAARGPARPAAAVAAAAGAAPAGSSSSSAGRAAAAAAAGGWPLGGCCEPSASPAGTQPSSACPWQPGAGSAGAGAGAGPGPGAGQAGPVPQPAGCWGWQWQEGGGGGGREPAQHSHWRPCQPQQPALPSLCPAKALSLLSPANACFIVCVFLCCAVLCVRVPVLSVLV